MPITNIEYGALASSETLNNNFSYLDEKITTANAGINTSISSILANIATINSTINTISSSLDGQISTLNQKIETYRTKIKELVAKSNMLPNWLGCRRITITTGKNYVPASNGYVMLIPDSAESGLITINGVSMYLKHRNNAYDNASELTIIPVQKNDTLSVSLSLKQAYFVPIASVSVSGF